ncbi:MAG: hypothetical protein WB952_19070 [Terriglobales bacterium]
MKTLRLALSTVLVLFTTAAFAANDNQTSFEKLKALQGSWAGKSSEGSPVQVSNRLISRGSVLMSEIHGQEDMISAFYLDGDRLLMTHYCAVGNQPRMIGTISPDGKTITFNFLDATNVLETQPGHMQRLTVTMLDDNHHTEDWDFLSKDGSTHHHAIFDLQRTK